MQTKKSNLTIRIEPELKKEASALFRSLGLDLSTATGIFYRQAIRYHGLPFEVKLD
ncbi:MAG TPA: type II toxin-antitoxin system RelB/DinJ family antitoxin [Candidatus Ornithospirochaeta avicola]|uniref:Type II toxin-antitoxin system RelB/DinJ family antitoxin n=1 Tax=Candidatus Ornithospirochaeta avicola TaxID=2840896 RepID=A0A9D1PTP2_9SPIO|nr:type II toxin-antitoxin system RelB/DinJ family antitoxin [Candidatus Ornithospirochaeta avicola]